MFQKLLNQIRSYFYMPEESDSESYDLDPMYGPSEFDTAQERDSESLNLDATCTQPESDTVQESDPESLDSDITCAEPDSDVQEDAPASQPVTPAKMSATSPLPESGMDGTATTSPADDPPPLAPIQAGENIEDSANAETLRSEADADATPTIAADDIPPIATIQDGENIEDSASAKTLSAEAGGDATLTIPAEDIRAIATIQDGEDTRDGIDGMKALPAETGRDDTTTKPVDDAPAAIDDGKKIENSVDGTEALRAACERGRIDEVQALLNEKNGDPSEALYSAAQENQGALVRWLIDEYGDKATPGKILEVFVLLKSSSPLRCLIEAGVDSSESVNRVMQDAGEQLIPHYVTGPDGLGTVRADNQTEAIKCLVEAGIDLSVQLKLAVQNGEKSKAWRLVNAGVNATSAFLAGLHDANGTVSGHFSPNPYPLKNAIVARIAKRFIGKLTYSGREVPVPELGYRIERKSDFSNWLIGGTEAHDKPGPLKGKERVNQPDPEKGSMHCWEFVMFAAYHAGRISFQDLINVYDNAAQAGKAAADQAETFGKTGKDVIAAGDAEYYGVIGQFLGLGAASYATGQGGESMEKNANRWWPGIKVPAGSTVFFRGLSWVGISLGSTTIDGKDEILILDAHTRGVQRTTILDWALRHGVWTVGYGYISVPPPVAIKPPLEEAEILTS